MILHYHECVRIVGVGSASSLFDTFVTNTFCSLRKILQGYFLVASSTAVLDINFCF